MTAPRITDVLVEYDRIILVSPSEITFEGYWWLKEKIDALMGVRELRRDAQRHKVVVVLRRGAPLSVVGTLIRRTLDLEPRPTMALRYCRQDEEEGAELHTFYLAIDFTGAVDQDVVSTLTSYLQQAGATIAKLLVASPRVVMTITTTKKRPDFAALCIQSGSDVTHAREFTTTAETLGQFLARLP